MFSALLDFGTNAGLGSASRLVDAFVLGAASHSSHKACGGNPRCVFSRQLLGQLPFLCHDGAGGLPRGSDRPLGKTEKGVPQPEFPWEFV